MFPDVHVEAHAPFGVISGAWAIDEGALMDKMDALL